MVVTGSLYDKNGIWQMMFSYYDENGKRKQKSKTTGLPVKGNKKKAKEMLDKLLQEYNHDTTRLLNKDMLFSDYMLQWLEDCKSGVRRITYENYEKVVKKHIVPYFKAKKITLQDLRTKDVDEYYKFKLETLSANTVRKHHANIHKALKKAIEYGLISSNPASAVTLPSIKKFEGDYYNDDEVEILKEIVKGTTIEVPVMLTAWYGFRRSEVLGLRWDSINFDKNKIHVEHTLVPVKGETLALDETKSKESDRYLPMAKEIQDYLQEVRKRQIANKEFYGDSYVDSGYVCTYDNGKYLKPNYLSHTFSKLLKDNADKIRKIRFHDLRHSAATRLLSSGFVLEDIQFLLGHSSVVTTQRYAHYQDKRKQDMINCLTNRKAS